MTRGQWATEQPGIKEHPAITFGDDAPIWELDVFRAAAGD